VATGSLWSYLTDRSGSQSEPDPETVDHAGSMRTISSAPVAPRVRTHAAWSGQELLVWSGVEPDDAKDEAFDIVDDGAAYDPTTDSWRKLPTAPISGRASAAAVWAGDRLVVWGGFSGPDKALDDGAAYLPDENAWAQLPSAPITGRGYFIPSWPL
jgi:N-acetylneuraminic acid mutarotase